jgi:3-oxoacyl-[acyl-carrier protein] reductase
VKLDLEGKRALVTGSNSGIGAGIAELLAEEGVAVIVHGRDRARADAVADTIRQAGGRVAVAIGDVATDEGAAAVAEAALGAFGGIDILVNNAGGRSSEAGAVEWLNAMPQDWMDTYSKNTVAALRMIRLLAPAMKERGWGRLIQISSSAANSPNAAVPHYAAAKAAIINLTVSLSKAFARTGVTANTVSPGMVSTPALDEWFENIEREKGWEGDRARTEAWVLEHLVVQTVGRVGTVRDIAALVAFVASPVSGFINGANLRIDGGRSPAVN